MNNNPEFQKRKSIRLKDFDYSKEGLYFITICVHNHECLFGKIENDNLLLNELGKVANNFWIEIPNHFPSVELHEFIIMPNHIHGIIEIVGTQNNEFNPIVGTRHGVSKTANKDEYKHQFSKPIPGSISTIINQYKSSVKRWCNKNGHKYFQWQSRFYDHIIRSDFDYQNISNYIIHNPAKWDEDKYYGK
ncbi:MAG TPA: transposase [Ignavibacteria bacterium]|nr:transposase [Ignavibacteria bacterium]